MKLLGQLERFLLTVMVSLRIFLPAQVAAVVQTDCNGTTGQSAAMPVCRNSYAPGKTGRSRVNRFIESFKSKNLLDRQKAAGSSPPEDRLLFKALFVGLLHQLFFCLLPRHNAPPFMLCMSIPNGFMNRVLRKHTLQLRSQ